MAKEPFRGDKEIQTAIAHLMKWESTLPQRVYGQEAPPAWSRIAQYFRTQLNKDTQKWRAHISQIELQQLLVNERKIESKHYKLNLPHPDGLTAWHVLVLIARANQKDLAVRLLQIFSLKMNDDFEWQSLKYSVDPLQRTRVIAAEYRTRAENYRERYQDIVDQIIDRLTPRQKRDLGGLLATARTNSDSFTKSVQSFLAADTYIIETIPPQLTESETYVLNNLRELYQTLRQILGGSSSKPPGSPPDQSKWN